MKKKMMLLSVLSGAASGSDWGAPDFPLTSKQLGWSCKNPEEVRLEKTFNEVIHKLQTASTEDERAYFTAVLEHLKSRAAYGFLTQR